MGKANEFDVEEKGLTGPNSSNKKKGYFFTKKQIIVTVLVALVLFIAIGIIAAYAGPGDNIMFEILTFLSCFYYF